MHNQGDLDTLYMRRWASFVSSRRKIFGFEPVECDESVKIINDKNEAVEIPLEAHSIGTFGPSIIPFNRELLDVLACPISGDALVFDEKNNVLISERVGVAFPINKAGMPIFLKKWAIMDLKVLK